MHHFFTDQIPSDGLRITGTDANHILRVLRLGEGDLIEVSAGDGRLYRCEISLCGEDYVDTVIRDINDSAAELPAFVTLYQGYPKGDKLEMIIQKTIELGVGRIVPVSMQRSVVKLTQDKAEKKRTRYQSIAEAAAKQSRRGVIPEVGSLLSMKQAAEDAAKSCDLILLPYENAEGMDGARALLKELKAGVEKKEVRRIGIFIGPEGGFEASEVELLEAAGARTLSLGHRILRTETAGMAMMAILGFLLDP